MTCREKLMKEHPDKIAPEKCGGCHGCPSTYGYLEDNNALCKAGACTACWNREIPGEDIFSKDGVTIETAPGEHCTLINIPPDGSYVEILGHRITGDFKTFEGFLEYLRDLEAAKRELDALKVKMHETAENPVESLQKVATSAKFAGAAFDNLADAAEKVLEDINQPVLNITSGTGVAIGKIKDSGDRTEFATGAVRDMREGKGRCDLMPLEVVAHFCADGEQKTHPLLSKIAAFMSNNDTEELYQAIGIFTVQCYNSSPSTMLLEVAKHFEEGAKKYGENNWQKGIPVKCYIDSAVRHYLKWLRGDKDEPHDRAFVWNLMCCIWEVDYHKEDTVLAGKCGIFQDGNGISLMAEAKLLPVTEAPMVRLGDLHAGMFDFDGDAYFKVNSLAAHNFYVDVLTGAARELHPDILVTPLEIWKVDDGESEEDSREET